MTTEKQSPSMILYQILSAAFCVIVVISNIISAKMVTLSYPQGFNIPAGLITYPLAFLISNLVTEFFGSKKAKLMIYVALIMNGITFGLIQLALVLPASTLADQTAFQAVLGLSGLRIFSSLTAFIAAQILDVQLYAFIKKLSHSRFLWLRNNGSMCLSQLIDTVVIDLIYLYWGLEMTWCQVLPIMFLSYGYKAFFSLAITPLFYLCVFLVRKHAIPANLNKLIEIQGVKYEPVV